MGGWKIPGKGPMSWNIPGTSDAESGKIVYFIEPDAFSLYGNVVDDGLNRSTHGDIFLIAIVDPFMNVTRHVLESERTVTGRIASDDG